MTDSEREWAKQNKLRKTGYTTFTGHCSGQGHGTRIVYQAHGGGKYDGQYFYLDGGHWCNLPESYLGKCCVNETN